MVTDQDKKPDGSSPAEAGPILVAVDFTPDSKAALIWACHYAGCIGAAVKVLHVIHDPADAPGSYGGREKDSLRPFDEIAKDLMAKFLEQTLKDADSTVAPVDLEPIIVEGLPATRIVEMAEKIDAQIIVMGSRGRTGLPHLLLGSKAERVAQLSPIPVTIVKAQADDD